MWDQRCCRIPMNHLELCCHLTVSWEPSTPAGMGRSRVGSIPLGDTFIQPGSARAERVTKASVSLWLQAEPLARKLLPEVG